MELTFIFEDGSEAIAHYGVKGMRWGNRKSRYERLADRLRNYDARASQYQEKADAKRQKFKETHNTEKYRYKAAKAQRKADKQNNLVARNASFGFTMDKTFGGKGALVRRQYKAQAQQARANRWMNKAEGNTKSVMRLEKKAQKQKMKATRVARKMAKLEKKGKASGSNRKSKKLVKKHLNY